MQKIAIITLFSFYVFGSAVYSAATCTLDGEPSPAILTYEENIDQILSAVTELASQASCVDGNMSAGNVKRVLDIMQGSSYDVGNFFRSSPFFLDTSDKMLLPSAKKHDDYIHNIQQRILETGAEIGSRCAGDIIRFQEDVQIKNSRYKTKNRILQEVLNHAYAQNSEVLSFYRDLVSNIKNNEYLNEDKFTIVPVGFSDDMREYYSSANIQKCHDEDAKKQKIEATQKKGLAEAIKYPQAVNVWKKAFEFLLYGRSAQPDTPEEANPSITAHAKEGGLGNSIALHNKLFQKIFGFFGNMQGGPAESVREAGKQNASGKELVPSTFSEIAESVRNAGGLASPSFIEREYGRMRGLSGSIEMYISTQEQNLVDTVIPSSEKNYLITTPAIQALEANIETQKKADEIFTKICRQAYEQRQAINYPGKNTCDEILAESSEASV